VPKAFLSVSILPDGIRDAEVWGPLGSREVRTWPITTALVKFGQWGAGNRGSSQVPDRLKLLKKYNLEKLRCRLTIGTSPAFVSGSD
jgi:hypothetical protein